MVRRKGTGGRKRQYEDSAERVAAYRSRNADKRTLSVLVDQTVLSELDAFMARRVDSANPDETKAQVVERAIRSFLRKR